MVTKTLQVQINGVSISCESAGTQGPALFFVHGNSAAGDSFAPQLNSALASQFRLFAIDLPGHGASGRLAAAEDYTVERHVSTVAGAARALEVEDAVFVGHSLGGHLLLEAASRLPRAKGFALFGTPPLRKPPNLAEAFLHAPVFEVAWSSEPLDDRAVRLWEEGCFAPTSPRPGSFVRNLRRTDPHARAGLGQSIATGALLDEAEIVRTLRAPLALFHAEKDALVNGAYIAGLPAPTRWRGKLHVVPGSGHSLPAEAPEAFNRLLEDFAREVTRS